MSSRRDRANVQSFIIHIELIRTAVTAPVVRGQEVSVGREEKDPNFLSREGAGSVFPARLGSKDCISSQLFGARGSIIFGTELAPKAIDVLGSCWPASHGRTRLWGKKRKKKETISNVRIDQGVDNMRHATICTKAPVMACQHPHHCHQRERH